MKGPSLGGFFFFFTKLCECNVKIKVEQNNCNKQIDPRFILWQINCTTMEQNIYEVILKAKQKIFSIHVKLHSFYFVVELKVYKNGMNNHSLFFFLF
jgi:hypothetical protein